MNRTAESTKGPRPITAVAVQQTTVLQNRNGIRRRARSVIAPSSGERTKMRPIETAVIRL